MPLSPEVVPRERPASPNAVCSRGPGASGADTPWRFLDHPEVVPRAARLRRGRNLSGVQEDELLALSALCELREVAAVKGKQLRPAADSPRTLSGSYKRHRSGDPQGPGDKPASAPAVAMPQAAACHQGQQPMAAAAQATAGLVSSQHARSGSSGRQSQPRAWTNNPAIAAINEVANALARNAATAVSGPFIHSPAPQAQQQQQHGWPAQGLPLPGVQQLPGSHSSAAAVSDACPLGPLAQLLAHGSGLVGSYLPPPAVALPFGDAVRNGHALPNSAQAPVPGLVQAPQLALLQHALGAPTAAARIEPRTAFTAGTAALHSDGRVGAAGFPSSGRVLSATAGGTGNGCSTASAHHVALKEVGSVLAPNCPAGAYHVLVAHQIKQRQLSDVKQQQQQQPDVHHINCRCGSKQCAEERLDAGQRCSAPPLRPVSMRHPQLRNVGAQAGGAVAAGGLQYTTKTPTGSPLSVPCAPRSSPPAAAMSDMSFQPLAGLLPRAVAGAIGPVGAAGVAAHGLDLLASISAGLPAHALAAASAAAELLPLGAGAGLPLLGRLGLPAAPAVSLDLQQQLYWGLGGGALSSGIAGVAGHPSGVMLGSTVGALAAPAASALDAPLAAAVAAAGAPALGLGMPVAAAAAAAAGLLSTNLQLQLAQALGGLQALREGFVGGGLLGGLGSAVPAGVTPEVLHLVAAAVAAGQVGCV